MTADRAAIGQGASAAWPWLARLLTVAIIIVAGGLLFNLSRKLDWNEVFHAAGEIGGSTLAAAAALVCAGYVVYSCYDLLARKFAGHALAGWKVLSVAAVSYAINLNLGVLLGGIGVRLRLYRKLGVRGSTAAKIVLFSSFTNWLGYCWLAGTLFVIDAAPLPPKWDVGRDVLQLVGFVLLIAAFGYVGLCAWSSRRNWTWRAHRITLPSAWMALTQSAISILSWVIMGGIVYVLLQQTIPYSEVLAVLLFSGIAGVIARIPGGLGVTEAIFVGAFAGRLPDHQVLAALLMYRVVYALAPLCLALPAYLAIEARFRWRARQP